MIFFAFCVYKNVLQKIGFCIWMKITTTAIIERQHARFYINNKQKKLLNLFIYKKPALCVTRFFIEFLTFAKGGDIYWLKKRCTLCYIFIFKKTVHFALRWQKQRAWHYALYFNIQKTMHFSLPLYWNNLSCSTDT